MDQYVDSRQKEILWDLLANPADTGSAYIQSLERLAHEYPQSGILQVMLARAGDKQQLGRAAIYCNPRALHKLINHPERLAKVDTARIISVPAGTGLFTNNAATNAAQVEIISGAAQTTHLQDVEPVGNIEEITAGGEIYTQAAFTEPDTGDVEVADPEIEGIASQPVEQNAQALPADGMGGENGQPVDDGEIVDADILPETDEQVNNTPQQPQEPVTDFARPAGHGDKPVFGSRFPKRDVTNSYTPEPDYPQQHDIEDEVYDEIVSIEDIGFEAVVNEPNTEPQPEVRFSDPYAVPEEEEASPVLFHQPQPVAEPVYNAEQNINNQEERLILGGIVNSDYLSFDKKLDELRNTAPAGSASDMPAQPAAESHEVSRYDDDKMPYTFMWWLDKTRKEHAANLQPYATHNRVKNKAGEPAGAPKANTADELQQQYYENIFSLTSVSAVDRDAEPAGIAFDHNKKEDVIIERFIHTEPQIKPLSADKLDNENKAKKSSEDQNELVTETLARIYCDQMLYHKAIATYKKLILKFPEKKLYFASQIEQLEKKTN
ncbi:hypothetical protein GWR56_02975 [Mucilaginibacter sp. 14171R-50]|uniref:hypothetical protein n=1 Tax=Mucilaginibacter sp. 14171R-50 TaxID=2703789 RepID=UPI00138CE03E|nr:hypothetical protein [Mucilaginibacter sp. 14171R-50]QHS54558.1 hypothetical protein GWR56_02975 [Mucilaginibacter sp. 14171R-50]